MAWGGGFVSPWSPSRVLQRMAATVLLAIAIYGAKKVWVARGTRRRAWSAFCQAVCGLAYMPNLLSHLPSCLNLNSKCKTIGYLFLRFLANYKNVKSKCKTLKDAQPRLVLTPIHLTLSLLRHRHPVHFTNKKGGSGHKQFKNWTAGGPIKRSRRY